MYVFTLTPYILITYCDVSLEKNNSPSLFGLKPFI